MKIIDVEQGSEEWKEARQTVITGTRVKKLLPPSRKIKTGGQKMDFWSLVAEYVSYGAEEDSPMVRGTNLEKENAEKAVEKMKLKSPCYDCGLWTTDDGLLGYSPDAAEDTTSPTWAIECKSLNTAEHLFLILQDKFALGKLPDEFEPLFPERPESYRGIMSVAEEHRNQIIQAFVVNPKLKVLYYSLYDPRIVVEAYIHHIIVVKREEIEEEIKEQTETMLAQAKLAKTLAVFLAKEVKKEEK